VSERPEVGPVALAVFYAALAAVYSLLSLGSGLAVQFSVLDTLAAVVVWGLLGLGGGFLARRFAGILVRERPVFAWTLAAGSWAFLEAAFTAIVVAKPTRWPPLVHSAIGLGLPALVVAIVALTALRRGSREALLRRVHPALMIVAAWTTLAALLMWAPRWLRAFGNDPSFGWILWGLFDLLWIATGVCAVVVAGAAVLVTGRRRRIALVAGALLISLQFVPVLLRGGPAATAPAGTRPSIVWIVPDGIRADHVSAYGYRRPTTPVFDRLAGEGTLVHGHIAAGVRTENTYSKMLPLAPTLDRYAQATPVPLSAARELLPASVISQTGVVETLHERGYQTALFHVYHDFLEDKGMQPWLVSFDEVKPTRLSGDATLGAYLARMVIGDRVDGMPRMDRWALIRRRHLAGSITDDVEQFLAERDDPRPLFLIVHLAGVHEPFFRFGTTTLPDPPNPYVKKYDDTLRSTDAQLGTLVASVRARLPGATTFVFADHGTVIAGEPLLPQYLTVPLLVLPALPGAPPAPTGSQDIAATTLALAGNEPPRCDARLARDLRCSDPPAQPRVMDHTGHGKLMLVASLDGNLVATDLKAKPEIGSVGAAVTVCEFFQRVRLIPNQLAVSPLETRLGLPSRLARQLANCGSR
jgi:hypothetical protein